MAVAVASERLALVAGILDEGLMSGMNCHFFINIFAYTDMRI